MSTTTSPFSLSILFYILIRTFILDKKLQVPMNSPCMPAWDGLSPRGNERVWSFICVRDLVPGDKMGPRQQWRASERVDNWVADPCSMLDSTARLLPLSAFFQWAYLLGVAKRCMPILLYQLGSVPARRCRSLRYKKKKRASVQLSLCGENSREGWRR